MLQRLEQNVRGDTERGVLVESNSSTTSDYGTFSHSEYRIHSKPYIAFSSSPNIIVLLLKCYSNRLLLI